MKIGQRILIIGSGGAGKSTLARRLGELTGIPVIHLDAHYWLPGWVVTPKEEWAGKVDALLQGDRWIMDGNFGSTLKQRLPRADTVIYLDYPSWLCLWRVLRRRVQYHGRTRPDIGPGCPESIDAEFIQWVINFPRNTRPKLLNLLAEHAQHAQIIIHKSPAETRRLLEMAAEK